jgi:hypothetical protein
MVNFETVIAEGFHLRYWVKKSLNISLLLLRKIRSVNQNCARMCRLLTLERALSRSRSRSMQAILLPLNGENRCGEEVIIPEQHLTSMRYVPVRRTLHDEFETLSNETQRQG